VWAVEQDDLSKRQIPQGQEAGQDVFVPWVVAQGQHKATAQSKLKEVQAREENDVELKEEAPVFNRYYHMFSRGELTSLVHDAARELRLFVGAEASAGASSGLEIVQDGWERSNYYVEIRRWKSD
jgi:tRNA (uracil-5-)-methyltransferase TRM9